ncbi:glycosyltransferase, partial [Candidatus Babeliales bacterium]|nr:glycosyltransferase [Candidatus Babeliales bacterium]
SVDESDFTYPMRHWMRPMEIGMSKAIDFIFVCSDILKQLCIEAGYEADHIYKVGLPYNSMRLIQQIVDMGFCPTPEKDDFVLFSSRFDDEKNPHFFLDLVEACPDIQFKLVKPRAHLSNNPEVVSRAFELDKSGTNLEIVDTSDKLIYYRLLAAADIQFNCAEQDWVSWTLLEALTFGCKPLYPQWKDFPYELAEWSDKVIYEKSNLDEAREKLYALRQTHFDHSMRAVYERHDKSWEHYLKIMGFTVRDKT